MTEHESLATEGKHIQKNASDSRSMNFISEIERTLKKIQRNAEESM